MKKFFKSRAFLLAAVLLIAISAFSFIATTKTTPVCLNKKVCCHKVKPDASGEMLWDVLSHQFISVVFFQQ